MDGGGWRFVFADHQFRSPRSYARSFRLCDHTLDLVAGSDGRFRACARLVVLSGAYQTAPSPEFLPPRLVYRTIGAGGAERPLALCLVLDFTAGARTEFRGEARLMEPLRDADLVQARWTLAPYGKRGAAYRLKQVRTAGPRP